LVIINRQWCAEGVEALPDLVNLRDYGSFVDSLKANATVRIEDVVLDARTANHVPALLSRGVRSLVNVPIVERGRLVAFFFINEASTRRWTDEDVSFVQEIADRTRVSAERAAAVQALRLANDRLEGAVVERTNELMAAQEALRQSQKMEAIGQLTGGIAHDFNNLLGGMSAALQVLQARRKLGKFDGVERYLSMAQDSIKRASALTQRLLAFARRQTVDSKPIDINRLLNGLEELISRSVGPDVQVEVVGSGGLWTSKVDPSQLENAVLNLCINSRDAMLPGGGRLTIETANKWFDGRLAAERELVPGQYVSVCVTDTGSGMTHEVAQRIFDPFFTTKPLGQGTGLGLSMVYGFVRQSGGQVRVYSEIGKGTTMCLYLPRHLGEPDQEQSRDRSEFVGRGDGESILLIEDEETIRLVVSEMLVEAGYKVATAEDGPSGLRILEQAAHVDFLITDVGLPGGLNGRQVADAARKNRPDLKVLFITGYAENAAVGDGHLERGMEVLTKPFDIAALVAKVRVMLRETPLGYR
jgi:signal transduction histidine kinase/ActR/RegA family two-component response regulator